MISLEERITNRFNRARLILEAQRAARPLTVVLLGVVLACGGVAFLITRISNTLLRDVQTVRFAVTDATGVKPGVNEVRLKGLPIGDIVAVTTVNGHAEITTSIQSKYGKVYRDARAELRPTTALQDMYLNITDRGHPQAGIVEGATAVDAANTSTSVNVSDVLDTFGADERIRLQQLLNNLGNGLADHGRQLQYVFAEAVPFITNAKRITDTLAARKTATKRLIHNVALLTTELGGRTETLRALVRDGDVAAAAFADNASSLDDTVRQLALTVAELDGSLSALRRALPNVNTAARRVSPLAARLPKALDDVDELTSAATPALMQLRRPVRQLAPTAATLPPLTDALDMTVSNLRRQADTVNLVTESAVSCKLGIQRFFQWNTSMTKFGDADGAFPRGNLAAGAQSLGIANPYERALTACDGKRAVGGRPATSTELGESGR